MRITELIAALQNKLDQYGDLEVFITWEGVIKEVNFKNIYKVTDPTPTQPGSSLFIDADENHYKHEFAADPNEGEEYDTNR